MIINAKERSHRSWTILLSAVILLYAVSLSFLFGEVRGEAIVDAFSEQQRPTVVVDAGHGGEDSGAVSPGNVYEKDLNLEIALKLGEYLEASGYNVVYTRTEDKLLYTEAENIKGLRKISDLKNRTMIANSYSGAILVSIHMNSFGMASCSGLQVYYGTNDPTSQTLAESVQGEVVKRLQPTNKRRVKSGSDIYVLENSTNPAILVECGFLSNPEECEKLCEKKYQKELSFAILCGIIEYIGK